MVFDPPTQLFLPDVKMGKLWKAVDVRVETRRAFVHCIVAASMCPIEVGDFTALRTEALHDENSEGINVFILSFLCEELFSLSIYGTVSFSNIRHRVSGCGAQLNRPSGNVYRQV